MDKTKESITIDKNSPVPIYFQIKQEIVTLIQNGTYQPGDRLPTEMELCKQLDISRPTVRQAFQELINEGYITRQKAKGTFVSKPKVEGYFFKHLLSYNDEMKALGLKPKTNVIVQEKSSANSEVVKQLKLDKNADVFHLTRLRYANDEVMVYVQTFVPYGMVEGIEKEDFVEGSLYALMKEKYNVKIAYVDRTIEASNAPSDIAKLLDIHPHDAIYSITTIAYDAQNIPIEYSIARYRGDRNKFTIRLVQQ